MKAEYPILDRIQGPHDLKELSIDELAQLSEELRGRIIDTVSHTGGHLSPSLGTVELTVALHRVFNAPEDHIFWDVGHQVYSHKLLTGRKEEFDTLRQTGGLSGFCNPQESEYDPFVSGHAGSALSAAIGFSASKELRGDAESHTIAVVGDGALINGITMEALNNLSSTSKRLIIILNDNKMSIDKSIGAISRYLNGLTTGRSYKRFKAFSKMMLQRLPSGNTMIAGIQQFKSSMKDMFVPGLFFEEMGIRYVGPINGHDIPALLRNFEHAKSQTRPVLVHVITEKGHGCEYARQEPDRFHGTGIFDPETGKSLKTTGNTFSKTFGRTLEDLAEADETIVAVTAAMASGCGISHEFIRKYSKRFFDVGIAEEHAVVFAGGLAASGLHPVVPLYSTFLQRALDCVFHDVCLMKLPVLLCIDRAGAVEDGPTHHGIYDLAFLLEMPGLTIMAPECEATLSNMMKLGIKMNAPVAIRYPRGGAGHPEDEEPHPLEFGRAVCHREGSDLAIWTYGRDVYEALRTADILSQKYGLEASVWNARFLKPFDTAALCKCGEKMPVFTLEDSCVRGGLGTLAAEALIQIKHHEFHAYGWSAEDFVAHGNVEELRKAAGLQAEQLAGSMAAILGKQEKILN